MTQWDISKVKEFVENLGYTLMNTEYTNNKSLLIIQTKENYKCTTTLNSLLKSSSLSPFHKSNPYTVDNIKMWCDINGKSIELISKNYNGSHKKLKWKCTRENCLEEFDASWSSIISGNGCPYCSGRIISITNCLATKNPKLASEWHPTKNGDLTPFNVTCGNNKKVWWKCSNHSEHEWFASISSRHNGRGCPYCSGNSPSKDYNLLITNPDIVTEWDFNRNIKRPEDYTPNSGCSVWWVCKNNDKHIWKSKISHRTNGSSCPYCSGRYADANNNLLIDNPSLCKEWDYNKNKYPPAHYTPYSSKKVWWVCNECGDNWFASIKNRNKNNSGCPQCNKSKGEKKILEILSKFNIENMPQMTYGGLLGINNGSLSYDFYLPKFNLLIEYQGEFHDGSTGEHTKLNLKQQQEHDKRKRMYAESNNIRLLEIWYWDFDKIEPIIKNVLQIFE